MYSTELSFERAYAKHKKAGRNHSPEAWLNSEMKGTKELIKAFICDNADRSHTFNLIIIGDTLYVDEGNDGKNLFYYQLAIRLPGGVYIVNMRTKYDTQIQYIYKVLQHNQTWIKFIMLPTLNHKKSHGKIDPDQLRKAISEETDNSVVKRALIRYEREQKQATAIEDLNQLHITLEQLQYPDRHGIYNRIVIEEALKQLQHTKTVCATLDEYLNILTQYPELRS
jgi:hypothetical protein